MPIRFSEPGEQAEVAVILGYGDIGIGHIDNDQFKGVGLVQLRESFAPGAEVPEDQQQGLDSVRVVLLLRNQRGLAELRKAVSAIEKSMGVNRDTMLDKMMNHYMTELGAKDVEIERLTYELAQARGGSDG